MNAAATVPETAKKRGKIAPVKFAHLVLRTSQFDEMLDHAQWMFLRANEVLHRKTSAAEVKDSILSRDKSINDLLRSIPAMLFFKNGQVAGQLVGAHPKAKVSQQIDELLTG